MLATALFTRRAATRLSHTTATLTRSSSHSVARRSTPSERTALSGTRREIGVGFGGRVGVVHSLRVGCSGGVRGLSTVETKVEDVWTKAPPVDVIQLSPKNWKQEVEDNLSHPIIVDCFADWCRPCKLLAPLLLKHTQNTKGLVKIATLDVEKHFEFAAKLKITSIPAVFGYFRGKVVEEFVGLRSEAEVEAFVKKLQDTAIAEANSAATKSD